METKILIETTEEKVPKTAEIATEASTMTAEDELRTYLKLRQGKKQTEDLMIFREN